MKCCLMYVDNVFCCVFVFLPGTYVKILHLVESLSTKLSTSFYAAGPKLSISLGQLVDISDTYLLSQG